MSTIENNLKSKLAEVLAAADDSVAAKAASASALTEVELEALRAAESNLQAAPWLVWDDGDIGTGYPVEQSWKNRKTGETERRSQESLWLFNGSPDKTEQSEALVLLRNRLPGLLARLTEAEGRVAELEIELDEERARNRPPF